MYNMASLLDGWIWIWPFVTLLCVVSGQIPCTRPEGIIGECKPVFDCDVLLQRASGATPAKPLIQNYLLCGLEKDSQVQVCCPRSECTTPEGNTGSCVTLLSCPHLMKMLTRNPSIPSMKHVQNHICPDSENVCCTSEPHTEPSSIQQEKTETDFDPDYDTEEERTEEKMASAENEVGNVCQLGKELPDPDGQCCGIDASSQTRIVGGEDTEIDEYPWLVLLEYMINNTIVTDCGGSLITGYHVLTAAHCLSELLVSVRLGEYNTSNSGKDCVMVGDGWDCNDGATSVDIEYSMMHPNYANEPYETHDIGFIKLTTMVSFTEFIRPICLPFRDITRTLSENDKLFVAGWGNTEANLKSEVKRKATVPFRPLKICRNRWKLNTSGFVCAGGKPNVDSCKGDSGGPLMTVVRGHYELVGIVSFGPNPCGQNGVPAVYAKVVNYLPWIKERIAED